MSIGLNRSGITVTILVVILAYIGYHWYEPESLPKCHEPCQDPIQFMSTKSPYLVQVNTAGTNINKDCSAHQVWMVIRHGTRNPTVKVIQKLKAELPSSRSLILRNHDQGRGNLCQKELTALKDWSGFEDLEESDTKILVPQGVTELHGIAKRYQQQFPHLFIQDYNNETFKFAFTKTQRAEASALAFTRSLFKDGHKNIYFPEPLHADPILRFYKDCPKWKQGVKLNPEAKREVESFSESKPFQEMLKRLTHRLGFESQLTKYEVMLMYIGCSFETAWNPNVVSPWCALFTELDFQILEYHQDLNYFYMDGYGHEITYKLACAAIRDMMSHFEERMKSPEGSPNVIAYFTHSGTTLKLLAGLGLFNDTEPLRSEDFESQHLRKWKTSHIDTFATNIAVILYKCSEDFRIGIAFQESEVRLPQCNHQFHCTYKEFFEKMSHVTEDCDKERMCS